MSINYTWLPAAKPNLEANSLIIKATKGPYLIDNQGNYIFDAISSWWCKPLGHCHHLVQNSITTQLKQFEHHIPANALNNNIEKLSSRLVKIFNDMGKVMYASDGSSAIEMALKLSYETRILENSPKRSKFIALSGAYHGETIFALGICGIESCKKNYQALLKQNYFIDNIPYVNSKTDPFWHDSSFDFNFWHNFFNKYAKECSALIIEPVIQGAAGMKIISGDFLVKLVKVARKYDLHIIADEIMVGLGRLGCFSVSKEVLEFEPDMVCFAKNLTAGSIPMSALVISNSICDLFTKHNKIFPHSHTHSCNGLATAVALSYLAWLDNPDTLVQIRIIEQHLHDIIFRLANDFNFITNPRAIGILAACDLSLPTQTIEKLFAIGLSEKIYLRPIGNTLYVMPPLNITLADCQLIYDRIYKVLFRINNFRKAIL